MGGYDILAVGYACLDYVAVVERLPSLDEKLFAESLLVQGGGPAATAMVAASRLGARTGLVASLADDVFGRQVADELEAEGVDVSISRVHAGGTSGFGFAMIERASGLRTIVGRRGEVPYLTPEDVDLDEVRRARVLLIDGFEPEAQLSAAAAAREAGVGVIFDAGNEKDGMKELIGVTDVLIASRGFGRDVGGSDEPAKAARNLFETGRVQVAAVTAGVEGAFFHTARGPFHQESFEVEAADTTGAGDAFHGAYAYAMVKGWSMEESARFAAAVAAMKCTKLGGRTGLPRLDEVETFLKSHSAR